MDFSGSSENLALLRLKRMKNRSILWKILIALRMAGIFGLTYLISKFSHEKDFLSRIFTDYVNIWQIPKNDTIPWDPEEEFWSPTAAPTPRLTGEISALVSYWILYSSCPCLYPKLEMPVIFSWKMANNHWCLFLARMWNRKCPKIWKIATTPAGDGGGLGKDWERTGKGLGKPWAGWQCPFSYWEMQKSRVSHSWDALRSHFLSLNIFSFVLTRH